MSNSKPVADGTVIMAEDQYAGRGQQQSKWLSQPGKNLTFSLLLQPSFLSLQQQFELNRIVSIAIAEVLERVGGQAIRVKWPNDIYWNDRKLGGILIENVVQGQQIKHSVIGIGLNINQDEFPPDAPNPASLKQILHTDYDLMSLLSQICSGIEVWYLRLKAGNLDAVRNAYLERLYWYRLPKRFKAGNTVFNAQITGVHNDGMLVLTTDDGNERAFNFKEIQFLNKPNS